jgi:predicted RNA-binding protein YlxR (DUF448 family)
VRPAGELVRVRHDAQGRIVVGSRGIGRGAWLCRSSLVCVEQALARRGFERAWRRPVGADEQAAIRHAVVEAGADRGGPAAGVCDNDKTPAQAGAGGVLEGP